MQISLGRGLITEETLKGETDDLTGYHTARVNLFQTTIQKYYEQYVGMPVIDYYTQLNTDEGLEELSVFFKAMEVLADGRPKA